MNIVLWIVQVLLAVLYGMAGGIKFFGTTRAREQMSWTKNRSDGLIRFVGIAELLGALGLFLPLVTGVLPWLTVLAAIGLTMVQLLAIFTEHLPKKEYGVIPINAVLLALSGFVAIGRWALFS